MFVYSKHLLAIPMHVIGFCRQIQPLNRLSLTPVHTVFAEVLLAYVRVLKLIHNWPC